MRAGFLVGDGVAAALDRRRDPRGHAVRFLLIPVGGAAFILDGPGAAAGAVLAAMDKEPKATVAGVLGAGLAMSFVSQLVEFYGQLWHSKRRTPAK
jgi:hypothetical protein